LESSSKIIHLPGIFWLKMADHVKQNAHPSTEETHGKG